MLSQRFLSIKFKAVCVLSIPLFLLNMKDTWFSFLRVLFGLRKCVPLLHMQGDTRLNQKWINCNVGNSKLSHKTTRLYYNSYPEGDHTEIPGTVLGQIFPGPWMFGLLNSNFFNLSVFNPDRVFLRECNIQSPILRYLLLLIFYTLLWLPCHQVPTLFQFIHQGKVISLSHAHCWPLVQPAPVSSSLNVFFWSLWHPCSSPHSWWRR